MDAFMDVDGSFHGSFGSFHCWQKKWKLPLLSSTETSTTIVGGNFHELSRASIPANFPLRPFTSTSFLKLR